MSQWRIKVNNILSEEVGMLSNMIIDEALDSMKITEEKLTKKNSGRFMRAITDQLPTGVDKKLIQKNIFEVFIGENNL